MAQPRRDELIAAQPKVIPTPGRCQIHEIFELLGKPYSLDLLYLLLEERPEPVRFVEIQKTLKMSPKTLSVRLRDFVDAGILTRTAYNEIPPRVDYAATDKAQKLRPLFEVLSEWSRHHDLGPTPA